MVWINLINQRSLFESRGTVAAMISKKKHISSQNVLLIQKNNLLRGIIRDHLPLPLFLIKTQTNCHSRKSASCLDQGLEGSLKRAVTNYLL